MTELQKYVSRDLTCFIYCRVSSDDQENNTSLEQQEIDGRAEAERRGLRVVRVFKETFTGAVWREREVFMEMRALYLEGEVDVIIFRTYDRLSREPAHYYIITEEMKEHAIETVCVKESNDNSAIGQIIRSVILGFAKVEREKTTQRVIDGKLARVTNKQIWNAGNKPPYGYEFADKEKGKLKAKPDEERVVQTIMTMRADRAGMYSIAAYLNKMGVPSPKGRLWSDTTLCRIIQNAPTLYSGIAYGYKNRSTKEYREGRAWVSTQLRPVEEWVLLPEGTVPRLIDADLVRRVQEAEGAVQQDSKRNTLDHEDYLLGGGFAKCGVCGGTLVVNRRRMKKNYGRGIYDWVSYCCLNAGNAMKKECPGVDIGTHILDKVVWDYVTHILKDLQIVGDAVDHLLKKDLFGSAEQATSRSIGEAQILLEQYKRDAREPGLTAAGRVMLFNMAGEQESLIQELEKEQAIIRGCVRSQQRVQEEYRTFLAWCQEFKAHPTEASYQQKRDALRHFGVSVMVRRKDDERGREVVTISPPGLMKMLVNVKVIQPSLDWSLDNLPFLLRFVDGRILFYTPHSDTLTPTV